MAIYKEKLRKAKMGMKAACEQLVSEMLMKRDDDIAEIHRKHADEMERSRRVHYDAIEQLRAEKDSACRERDHAQRDRQVVAAKLEAAVSEKNVLMVEKASLIKTLRIMKNL